MKIIIFITNLYNILKQLINYNIILKKIKRKKIKKYKDEDTQV